MKFIRVIKASLKTKYRVIKEDNYFYLADVHDNPYEDEQGNLIKFNTEEEADDKCEYLNITSNTKTEEALADVVKNFKKIVGFPLGKVFSESEDYIEPYYSEAADKICEYVYKKYNIGDDFIFRYELKLALSNEYVNFYEEID